MIGVSQLPYTVVGSLKALLLRVPCLDFFFFCWSTTFFSEGGVLVRGWGGVWCACTYTQAVANSSLSLSLRLFRSLCVSLSLCLSVCLSCRVYMSALCVCSSNENTRTLNTLTSSNNANKETETPHEQLLSWCFKPSQPARVTSGLPHEQTACNDHNHWNEGGERRSSSVNRTFGTSS